MDIIIGGRIFACPSFGEYPVYNEFSYNIMCNDLIRMNAYDRAIRKSVKNKIVVEIGTGSHAPLAIMCAEAGAEIVYAIEENRTAAKKAEKRISEKGLSEKIKVISCSSFSAELPEKADICVSELIGNIASAEGAPIILKDARRLLKPGGRFLPERSMTMIAPAIMPQIKSKNLFLDLIINSLANDVYKKIGFKFPFTRQTVFNFPESNILSSPGIFEDIDFNCDTDGTGSTSCEFEIPRDCEFNGFISWVNLYVDSSNKIDTFKGTSWAPVYLRCEKSALHAGDRIFIDITRKTSRNNVNPDYFIEGFVKRDNCITSNFAVESYHTIA